MYPSDGLTKVMVKFDLKLGSSRQGKALRAYVGSNFDVAIYLQENMSWEADTICCRRV